VWEGGFDERLGGPPTGYVDLWVGALESAALGKNLSGMNYKKVRTVSN
jgi:hypothetical protein